MSAAAWHVYLRRFAFYLVGSTALYWLVIRPILGWLK